MNLVTATQARANFFKLLQSVLTKHQPLTISHHQKNVVMLSEEDYEAIVETLELLATPGFKKSLTKAVKEIAAEETYTFDEVFPDSGKSKK